MRLETTRENKATEEKNVILFYFSFCHIIDNLHEAKCNLSKVNHKQIRLPPFSSQRACPCFRGAPESSRAPLSCAWPHDICSTW